jgi:uncharacterized protein (DUF1800 family)
MKTFHITRITFILLSSSGAGALAQTWPGPGVHPAWMREAVLLPLANSSNTAFINQGQLKNLARAAYFHMALNSADLPGPGAAVLDNLIGTWRGTSPGFEFADWKKDGAASTTNHYAPTNQGQLKNLALAYYRRLVEIGYWRPGSGGDPVLPWAGASDHKSAANIGQAKHLFNFNLTVDKDKDGLPDWWELKMATGPQLYYSDATHTRAAGQAVAGATLLDTMISDKLQVLNSWPSAPITTMTDEAKARLLIQGSFGPAPGDLNGWSTAQQWVDWQTGTAVAGLPDLQNSRVWEVAPAGGVPNPNNLPVREANYRYFDRLQHPAFSAWQEWAPGTAGVIPFPQSEAFSQYSYDSNSFTTQNFERHGYYNDTLLYNLIRNTTDNNDQLRQRMAWSLSSLLVASKRDSDLNYAPNGMGYYYDRLLNGAFGSYKDLLKDVALSPAMGWYLDMFHSFKAAPGQSPNLNFARELLQLFTVGLRRMNENGEYVRKVTGGWQVVETPQEADAVYEPKDVLALARSATGWWFDNSDVAGVYAHWIGTSSIYARRTMTRPMIPYAAAYHDSDAKDLSANSILLPATGSPPTIPAGMDANQELDYVLSRICAHEGLAPFLAKHFIKQFVTSDPSPGYVRRVANAAVVRDPNDKPVDVNLKNLIRAVLLDPEARSEQFRTRPGFGKIREPFLRFTHLMRLCRGKMVATNYATKTGTDEAWVSEGFGAFSTWGASSLQPRIGQDPLAAPTVFSYFSPFGAFRDRGMSQIVSSPESELETADMIHARSDFFTQLLFEHFHGQHQYVAAWVAAPGDKAMGIYYPQNINTQNPDGNLRADQVVQSGTLANGNPRYVHVRTTEHFTFLFRDPITVPATGAPPLTTVENVASTGTSEELVNLLSIYMTGGSMTVATKNRLVALIKDIDQSAFCDRRGNGTIVGIPDERMQPPYSNTGEVPYHDNPYAYAIQIKRYARAAASVYLVSQLPDFVVQQ